MIGESSSTTLRRRLLVAGIGLATIYGLGTFGYFFLNHGKWPLSDCAYMTVITLTTTGFGEILEGFDKVPHARLFTSILLVSGASIVLYFVSVMTTFLVEGEFFHIRRSMKMRKRIDAVSGHIIVCGIGRSGMHVVEELTASQWPFVAIDNSAEILGNCQEQFGEKFLFIRGDATDDKTLLDAGIERARGIVCSLPDDKLNLYIVISARGINPNLRIVAKAVDVNAVRKLKSAGADSVVSVNTIGGMRMVSEMIRPQVVTFLDAMMHDKDKNLRFDELTIPGQSPLVNTVLAQSDIRKERNLLIVAVKESGASSYSYSPGPQFQLKAGMTLIVLGETDAVQRLRESPLFRT